MKTEDLKKYIIGEYNYFNGPYGKRVITYADYIASGKNISFIEKYIIELEKIYANPHTKDSYLGKVSTDLYKEAKSIIRKNINATSKNSIIFVGTGATGALEKLSMILGVYQAPATKNNSSIINYIWARNSYSKQKFLNEQAVELKKHKPVVFISSYEHHSNELLWKEGFAEVVKIKLNTEGFFDIEDLKSKLLKPCYKNRLKIGSFSAASNVTGIKTPIYEIAKIMHKHNGYVFFDFAACAPYIEINMNKSNLEYFDGICLSPHKFIGGPGSSGLLVINNKIYNNNLPPTCAGGGTVDYVNSQVYEFTKDIEEREEAGTPGLLQAIKVALAFQLKEQIGINTIDTIENKLITDGINRLTKHPKIEILGPLNPTHRLSILSFLIKFKNGYLHDKYVTKLLSDLFGIQSRAGCLCAGPYIHTLFNYNKSMSYALSKIVKSGIGCLKPGVTRINYHFTILQDEFNYLCEAIEFIANYGYLFLNEYKMNEKTGIWNHKNELENTEPKINIKNAIKSVNTDCSKIKPFNKSKLYNQYLKKAKELAYTLKQNTNINYLKYEEKKYGKLSWFYIAK